MKLSDFDFFLPRELIAQMPAPARDRSRLMIVDRRTGGIQHDIFSNLPYYLESHPIMVFNNTRVIPAKLLGQRKDTGKPVEVLLVQEKEADTWEVLVKGLGGIKIGAQLVFAENLMAVMLEKREGRGILRFYCPGKLQSVLKQVAKVPLPPYIRRENDDSGENIDRERYQTVYAAHPGAVAVPTAGLHFTEPLLKKITSHHATVVFLTLHVGPGTFQPVRTENIPDHVMDKEFYQIPKDTWNRLVQARKEGTKVLGVGTTTTRALESVNLNSDRLDETSGWTGQFIYPGYKFKNVQQLLTNFHLPKSTLFLMVCAFAGKQLMKKAYETAKRETYRFYSYGDAMLIL